MTSHQAFFIERVTRIELALSAWEATHGLTSQAVDLSRRCYSASGLSARAAVHRRFLRQRARIGHGPRRGVAGITSGWRGRTIATSYDPYYNLCYVCGDVQDG